MSLPLRPVSTNRFYRVHHVNSRAHELTAWKYAQPVEGDLTGRLRRFTGRFDDPNPMPGTRWRALYLATSPIGALAESLQITNAVDSTVKRRRAEFILDDPEDARMQKADPTDSLLFQKIQNIRISAVSLAPNAAFVPLAESPWLMFLREKLDYGRVYENPVKLGELLGYDVAFGQAAAALIRTEVSHAAGLIVPSSLGAEFLNVIIFEDEPNTRRLRAAATTLRTEAFSLDDPLVAAALKRINQAPLTAEDLRVDTSVNLNRQSLFAIEDKSKDDIFGGEQGVVLDRMLNLNPPT